MVHPTNPIDIMVGANGRIDAGGVRSKLNITDLKFAQINLQHCKRATYTYCRGLKMRQTDISIIQEPWIRGKRIHGFGQLHNRLFYCRSGIRPRAAIHVAVNVNAMILNQLSNDDLVAVRICRNSEDGGDFVVVSAYLPYDSPVPPPGPDLIRVAESSAFTSQAVYNRKRLELSGPHTNPHVGTGNLPNV